MKEAYRVLELIESDIQKAISILLQARKVATRRGEIGISQAIDEAIKVLRK